MENLQSEKNLQLDNQMDIGGHARFELNQGYMVGDQLIADFCPEITAVEENYAVDGSRSVLYEVTVTDKSGKKGEPRLVSDITRLDWFRDFGICDIYMGKRDKKILAYKLQQEALACKNRRKKFYISPGFHMVERMPVVAMGNRIISLSSMSGDITMISASKLEMKTGGISGLQMAKSCINFMPGVTVLLFYAALLGAIKPLLNFFGVITDFIIAVVAPSGHLKSTLTRLYALWLVQREAQEISFSDTIRNDRLQGKIEECAAQNFLIDDYHTAPKVYTQNKYRDRLDQATRIVSGSRNSANIFVTSESFKDSSIFSTADRMLQIHIRRMTDKELSEYKSRLSEIPDYAMPMIAVDFLQKLLNSFDEVKKDVEDYLCKFKQPIWCKGSTRIGNQCRVLLLVEYLFRKYVCRMDACISANNELTKALQQQGELQLKCLDLLRQKDEECNILLVLDEIIKEGTKSTDIKISLARSQYSDQTGDHAFLDGNYFYITGNALQTCLMNHIGHPVSLRKVSDELHDAGVLVEDIDKRSKKFMSRRHYVIAVDALDRYCEVLRRH